LLVPLGQLGIKETSMTAMTAGAGTKSDGTSKAQTGARLDLAMAIHLAAGRFSSPSGMVFIQHNYLPQPLPPKR
jgi:hypothetical protein